MKKLIKLTIGILILLIFAFSNNKYVVIARTKAKVGYEQLVSYLKSNENQTISKFGNTIE